MMHELDVIEMLEDLDEGEFRDFKWRLQKEQYNDIPPIKQIRLKTADMRDVVDLMMQKYELEGSVQVMVSVFKKMSRNDLVSRIKSVTSKNEESGPADTTGEDQSDPQEAKLAAIRLEFINRVSDPVLRKLVDQLLDQRVITDHEMEAATSFNRADKARFVIDMVRKKGSRASSALITALIEVDSCLAEQLKLT